MMFSQFLNTQGGSAFNMPFSPVILAVLVIWTLIWKGIALWKSARNSQKSWFVVLVVVNTVGILEIIYLAFFQKKCECCGHEEHGDANKGKE